MKSRQVDLGILFLSYLKYLAAGLLAFLFAGSCNALVEWALKPAVRGFLSGWSADAEPTSLSVRIGSICSFVVLAVMLAAAEVRSRKP